MTGSEPVDSVAPIGADASGADGRKPGFNDLLLIAVIILTAVAVLLVLAMYGQPTGMSDSAELEPAVRVARVDDYPVGASRVVRLGETAVLVVRLDEVRYVAVAGASPSDGCLVEWEEEASRIVSPCSYLVYDVDGSVVAGLSTTPLARYPVFVRDGTVYVARGQT